MHIPYVFHIYIYISFWLHHINPLHMCLLARRVYRLCLPNCLRQAATHMSGFQIRQWWWAAGYHCQTNRTASQCTLTGTVTFGITLQWIGERNLHSPSSGTQDPASGLLGRQEEPSRSEQMGAISDWVSISIPDLEPDGLSQNGYGFFVQGLCLSFLQIFSKDFETTCFC